MSDSCTSCCGGCSFKDGGSIVVVRLCCLCNCNVMCVSWIACADVRSKVVVPLLLDSVVSAIATSCVSAGLVVEADVQSIVVAPLL